MITTENLAGGYGKKVVLSKVDIKIKPGEFTSLLGKNGAG